MTHHIAFEIGCFFFPIWNIKSLRRMSWFVCVPWNCTLKILKFHPPWLTLYKMPQPVLLQNDLDRPLFITNISVQKTHLLISEGYAFHKVSYLLPLFLNRWMLEVGQIQFIIHWVFLDVFQVLRKTLFDLIWLSWILWLLHFIESPLLDGFVVWTFGIWSWRLA